MNDIDGAIALTTSLDAGLDELSDGELIDLTRAGSTGSYAVLYDRYVYASRRLARHLGQREESDDVVSEAFAQVFDLLRRGKGPDRAFRAYLFTAIRHECGRRAKANKRVMPTDDDTKIDTTVDFGAGELDDFEKTAIRAAYESLPDRWRTVLWHLDVEGRKPSELAPLLGLKPNSVSALVYRARSGLRDAYLQQHVNTAVEPDAEACTDIRGQLAGVIRRTATMRDQERVHAHLENCSGCIAVYIDLQEVNRDVGMLALPLVATVSGIGATAAVANGLVGGAVFAHLAVGAKGLVAMIAATAAVATVAVTVPPSLDGPSRSTAMAQARSVSRPAVPASGEPTGAASGSGAQVRVAGPAASPSVVPSAAAHKSVKSSDVAPAPTGTTKSAPLRVTSTSSGIGVGAGPVLVTMKALVGEVQQVAPKTSAVLTRVLTPPAAP